MKILIAEDIPSHNKGEEALFLGLVESLKPLGATEIAMLSCNPLVDAKNYQGMANIIDARGITPAHLVDYTSAGRFGKYLNMLQFFFKYAAFGMLYKVLGRKALGIMTNSVWRAYCDADLVLMAHDNFFSPRYHGLLANFCHALGKKAVIYAGTTENPLFHSNKRFARALLKSSLEKLPLILLREEISRKNLGKLGMDISKPNIAVHTDLAFLVEPISREEANALLDKENIPRDRPIIGMTMTRRKLHFAYRHLPLEERYRKGTEAMTALVDYMTEKIGATVVFLPHSIGPTKMLDDRIIAEEIRSGAVNPARIFNIGTEYSVRQLKGMAGEFDMAVGARLHFIIDAVCKHVPSLLITHDGDARCHGIIGQMAGLEQWLYNVDNIEAGSLIALTQKLWDEKQAIKTYLESKVPVLKEDTYMHGKRLKLILK